MFILESLNQRLEIYTTSASKNDFWSNGFGDWIRIMYVDQQAEIFFEGLVSKKIKLHKGVRQGCLLSPLIFNLVIAVLAEMARQKKGIKGIEKNGSSHKLLLYADDTIFFSARLREPF